MINHPRLCSQTLVPIAARTSFLKKGVEGFEKPCSGSHGTGGDPDLIGVPSKRPAPWPEGLITAPENVLTTEPVALGDARFTRRKPDHLGGAPGSVCHGFEFPPWQDGNLTAEQAGLASKMGGGMGP